VYSVLPSVYSKNVGTKEYLLLAQQGIYFAAEYPACTFPCQRFDAVLADSSA
jgi:hypothetical protein